MPPLIYARHSASSSANSNGQPARQIRGHDARHATVISTGTVTPSEKVKLEVYVGSSTTPSIQTGASSAQSVFNTTSGVGGTAEQVQSIATKSNGNYVFYRFRDLAGNTSAWVQDGTVAPKPSDITSLFTTNVDIVYDSTATKHKVRVVANSITIPLKNSLQVAIAGVDLGAGAGEYVSVYYNNGDTDVTISSGSYAHGQTGGTTSDYVASFTAAAGAITYRFVNITTGNISEALADGNYVAEASAAAANYGYVNVASTASYVYNASGASLYFPANSKLEIYIHATTDPTATTVTATKSATFASATTITAGSTITGLTGVATATAADKVWYKYTDAAGNASAWTQDGTVPAAPTAAAIKVGQYNTATYISDASKATPKVSVTSAASAIATDTLFATITDGAATPVTVTNAVGVANGAAGAQTKDVTTATAAGLTDGALVVKAYMANAEGNLSTQLTGTAGTKDTVKPTVVITTTGNAGGTWDVGEAVVFTFSEAMTALNLSADPAVAGAAVATANIATYLAPAANTWGTGGSFNVTVSQFADGPKVVLSATYTDVTGTTLAAGNKFDPATSGATVLTDLAGNPVMVANGASATAADTNATTDATMGAGF